jgi:prepilin-type N-terminal cleavage/methylation domain-containing protein
VRRERGFTLVELLLSLSLGLLVSGVVLQALVGEVGMGQRLGRQWREKANQRRTLELIRAELAQAEAVSTSLPAAGAACPLGGRAVVLHLAMGPTRAAVTYSVGGGPSAIWRGQVLMRCGPAFALDGSVSEGEALNRVVIDGLAEDEGFTAAAAGGGALRLPRRQPSPPPVGGEPRIRSEAMATGG